MSDEKPDEFETVDSALSDAFEGVARVLGDDAERAREKRWAEQHRREIAHSFLVGEAVWRPLMRAPLRVVDQEIGEE